MITLYHNPNCSKSRETLALIRAKGIEPTIVEYLATPLTASQISALLAQSGLTAEQAMRTDNDIYQQQIAGKQLDEMVLINYLVQYPNLLNRPFVQTENGARLCRPPELVYEIL